MPKYYYHCNTCHCDFFAHHMISDPQRDCNACGLSDISKLLTKPLYFDKKVKKNATGEVTKKYIDDNKQILEDMKKEVKGETYD